MAPQTVAGASATSISDTSYDNPMIQSIWSDAESLLNSIFPAATSTTTGASTAPATVVMESSTYIMATDTSTLSTSTASPLSSSAIRAIPTETTSIPVATSTSEQARARVDKDLALGLGTGVGSIALVLLIVLLWFLRCHRVRSPGDKYQSSRSGFETQTWRGSVAYSRSFPQNYVDMQAPGSPAAAGKARLVSCSYSAAQPGTHNTFEPWDCDNIPTYTSYGSDTDTGTTEGMRQPQTSVIHELHGKSSVCVKSRPWSPQSASRAEGQASSADVHTSPVSPVDCVGITRARGNWSNHLRRSGSLQELHEHSHEASPLCQPDCTNPFSSDEDHELEAPSPVPVRRQPSSPIVYYPPEAEVTSFEFGLDTVDNRREM